MKAVFPVKESGMKILAIIRNDIRQMLFVVLSFVFLVAISCFLIYDIAEKRSFANVYEAIDASEAIIGSNLGEGELTLRITGHLIEKWLEQGFSNDEIQSNISMLTRIGEGRVPGLVDIYVYIRDTFISGINRSPPEKLVPQDMDWYILADAADGEIVFSPPYFDADRGKTFISLSKAVNGPDAYGVLALDMDFSHISDIVKSLHFSFNKQDSGKRGYGFLFDENFIFIVHPYDRYLGRPVDGISPEYAKLIKGIQDNPDMISTMHLYDDDGVEIVLVTRQINRRWYLGIACPAANYYSDVKKSALILSALGLVFMSILIFIMIQMSLSKARADQENREKSSFLARMSHEIRTPMNSILGMAELIQRKTISRDIQEYIEIVHQSGHNLLAIINDILDFSKIESGRLQIQSKNYYIASVINDMINMMRPRVAEKSLDFFVSVDSAIPAQLYGDDTRLRQILTNLLSNAIKYTRKGYISLDVKMGRMDSGSINLILSVQDSGIGIKPEDRDLLFKEFARMDSKANQGVEGTGLGLVIARALCKAMGGDVTVLSEYGKGSTFRAVIVQEYDNEKPVAWVNNPEKKRVLFYDWRPQYVQSMSKTLRSLGINFKSSSVLQEFINDLEYGQFDYAFISSRYAMDCIHVLGRRDKPLQLVIMVEPGEVSVYGEVTSILMPVYSIALANVLNDVTDGVLFQDRLKIQFTAPSARVLIVDDISTNLRVAKELMGPYNMDIQTCLSGSEAVNLVKKHRYDLVFMDHMMPGMDGIEATDFIRSIDPQDDYYRNLPIIALTANAIAGQREIFLEHGINDFLAKPIDIQKLNDILEKWLPPGKREEAYQQQRPDAKKGKAESLDIPGVDITSGLRNCGGGVSAYLNILSDFCRDAEVRLVQISDALSHRETRLYITLVHALKGAARSIGAFDAGDKAAWL